MNKRVKKLWLKALRGGRYKQTEGTLKFKGSYCCLDVLCNIYGKEKGVKWEKDYFGDSLMHDAEYLLPKNVVTWAKLNSADPVVPSKKKAAKKTLSNLNDDDGMSFKEIADVIEVEF